MKKIFSFVCAIAIAISASAMDRASAEAFKAEHAVPAFKTGVTFNQMPKAHRAPAGTPVSGIASATAMYYQSIWYLDAVDASNNLVVEFGFYNGKTDQIAGTYETGDYAIVYAVVAAGDSVKLNGTFHIDYVSEGTNYPIYHIYGSDLTDSLSRSFDYDFQVEVSAIDYQKYYYAVNYPEYCGTYFDCDYVITLDDAPIVVIGDTITVTFDGLKFVDNVAEQGWWQMYGLNADSTYSVSMSNVSTEVLLGTYDFATEMDAEWSYLKKINGDQVEQIKFAEGEVVLSQNANGTYQIEATLLARDGHVYVLHLTSKLVVPSDNVITMNYDATSRSINITTTNSDPYFFYVFEEADYEQDDFSQESVNAETDAWISTFAYYGYMSYYTFSGNQTISMVEFFGSYAATGDYIALAAPVDDDERNGDAKYLQFHFDYPEAIENTEVEVKAVKAIRDGQLIIIKNGVEYNAQGAIVK